MDQKVEEISVNVLHLRWKCTWNKWVELYRWFFDFFVNRTNRFFGMGKSRSHLFNNPFVQEFASEKSHLYNFFPIQKFKIVHVHLIRACRRKNEGTSRTRFFLRSSSSTTNHLPKMSDYSGLFRSILLVSNEDDKIYIRIIVHSDPFENHQYYVFASFK